MTGDLCTVVHRSYDAAPVPSEMCSGPHGAVRQNAPSGSIYYRFANRDGLVAEVWLRAVRDLQRGFLAAFDQPELDDAAFAAATQLPRWCAASLDQAIVLHRYRLEDLVDAWPDPLMPDRAALNEDLGTALRRHARLRYGSATGAALERTRFALVNLPGGSVRAFLDRRRPPPAWAAEAIGVASLAVLSAPRADHQPSPPSRKDIVR